MNPQVHNKHLNAGLVDVLNLAISKGQLDDAEIVLACLRALRPKVTELDTFEAWIAIKRCFWADAIRILRTVDATVPNFAIGKALMAYCQFAIGDPYWRGTADEVLEGSSGDEAKGLVRILVDPDGADEPAPAAAPTPQQTAITPMLMQGNYLRG